MCKLPQRSQWLDRFRLFKSSWLKSLTQMKMRLLGVQNLPCFCSDCQPRLFCWAAFSRFLRVILGKTREATVFQGLIPGDWEVGAFRRGLLEMAGYKELAGEEQRRRSDNSMTMYRNTTLRSVCELVKKFIKEPFIFAFSDRKSKASGLPLCLLTSSWAMFLGFCLVLILDEGFPKYSWLVSAVAVSCLSL